MKVTCKWASYFYLLNLVNIGCLILSHFTWMTLEKAIYSQCFPTWKMKWLNWLIQKTLLAPRFYDCNIQDSMDQRPRSEHLWIRVNTHQNLPEDHKMCCVTSFVVVLFKQPSSVRLGMFRNCKSCIISIQGMPGAHPDPSQEPRHSFP